MSFTKTVALPVSPDEAFALITDPERLRRWQTVSAVVDLRAGGHYRWTVTPGHVAAGTYREMEPGKRIVFGWGWDGNEDLGPDASTVTVTIEPADGGSLVTLVHEGLTEQQAAMHAEGWDHYFDRLARLAATGEAGPDQWAQTPENLTPVSAADAALAVIQPVLWNLTAQDRPKPTPCAEFSCHEVVEHLFGSLVQLGAMAGAQVQNPNQGSLENRISVMAAQAIDAWRHVDLDSMVPGPGGKDMLASVAAISTRTSRSPAAMRREASRKISTLRVTPLARIHASAKLNSTTPPTSAMLTVSARCVRRNLSRAAERTSSFKVSSIRPSRVSFCLPRSNHSLGTSA